MTTLQKNRVGQLFPGGLREFDTLVNQFFRGEGAQMWHAPASIWEAENTFHIELDAPGVAQENVDLTFNKGTLQVALSAKPPKANAPTGTTSAATAKSPAVSRCPRASIRRRSRPSSPGGVLHVTITKRPDRSRRKLKSKSV